MAAVAGERLARARRVSVEDHEPLPDELARVEAEHEERVLRRAREELQARDLFHTRIVRDLCGEALREKRAAEVRHVALEQPEVRVPDVDDEGSGWDADATPVHAGPAPLSGLHDRLALLEARLPADELKTVRADIEAIEARLAGIK